MRVTRRSFALGLAGLTALGALAACGDSPNANKDANKNASGPSGVLNIGMPNGPQTENHNPFLGTSSAASLGYRWMIFEPLALSNAIRPSQPAKPWLASKFEWAPDYKSLTLTIRDGVKWSDGQAF